MRKYYDLYRIRVNNSKDWRFLVVAMRQASEECRFSCILEANYQLTEQFGMQKANQIMQLLGCLSGKRQISEEVTIQSFDLRMKLINFHHNIKMAQITPKRLLPIRKQDEAPQAGADSSQVCAEVN